MKINVFKPSNNFFFPFQPRFHVAGESEYKLF